MKRTLFVLFALALYGPVASQTYLGMDIQPSPLDSIEDLPDLGDFLDFSGGVQVGEQCPDFQMFDLSGNPFRLYDELRPDRYTILFSLSITCDRVQHGFDTSIDPSIHNFLNLYQDDFNWIPIYTDEAHPIDVENCPSNCPPVPTLSLDGDTVWSHLTYSDRAEQAADLLFFGNSQNYGFDFPFDELYLDNPDNAGMVEIFQAPFSIVVLDCAGYVLDKAPFMNNYFGSQDNWDYLNGLAQQADSDQDMICNAREMEIGSDPMDPCDPYGLDSDGDGECDLQEELNGSDAFDPCDPIFVDVDEDGICDFEDTDINVPPCVENPMDSDVDGICDAEELINGTDPYDPCSPNGVDSDGDGICNNQEFQDGTSPYDICDPDNTDSDGDGYCDLEELAMEDGDPYDPCAPDFIDSDGDGICNLQEIQNGSSPSDPCDPEDTDSDEDGYCDVEEEQDGTNPQDACDPDDTDTDNDGICDNQEILDGTDPFVDESVGIAEYEGISDLKVYPNPLEDRLTVESSFNLQIARLFGADGRLIMTWTESEISSGLDVSYLASGAYTLKLMTDDLRFETVRLMK